LPAHFGLGDTAGTHYREMPENLESEEFSMWPFAPKQPFQERDSGYERLEQQIGWYDQKSGAAQRYFKWAKYLVITASAAIPILALLDQKIPTALLGGFIAVCEAVQHVNQWHPNWITYRSTCEALRHEKYAYLESADPYDGLEPDQARKLLVERTESL